MINSFDRIGMPDPFPESDQMMTSYEDNVMNKLISSERAYTVDFIYPEWRIINEESPQ